MIQRLSSIRVIIAAVDCGAYASGHPEMIIEFMEGNRVLYSEERTTYADARNYLDRLLPSIRWQLYDPVGMGHEDVPDNPEIMAMGSLLRIQRIESLR